MQALVEHEGWTDEQGMWRGFPNHGFFEAITNEIKFLAIEDSFTGYR